MNSDSWRRVKDLFSRASALEAPARKICLDEACRENPALRAEVESLLAAHGAAQAILDRSAADYLPAEALESAEDRWLDRRIGAYRLVARIGRGGMGDVYRAHRVDAHFDKEVAIKLVRAGYDTDVLLNRFKTERQILANLDHPGIARLLDGGATIDGLPYLVMELVDGEPIDRYCDHHALSIPDRLRIFRAVCAAVSYAHQHLVVHRDLKPSNILVCADGSVKLLDFGIAKLLQAVPGAAVADAAMTVVAAMTPAFSSPEQIRGTPVSTTTDVYSLGVVLYHLLTGRSPYRTPIASAEDAIRLVCESDVPRPSTAAAGEPRTSPPRPIPARDLDDITLKALRKEPDKRYASVEQLSDDVERYLTGRPVLAHGGRGSYLAAKFVRRHKIEIAAALMLTCTLIGAVVVTTHEAHTAQLAQARAERDFMRVRKLANSLLFELHDSIRSLPGSTVARQLLIRRAREYLDELADEYPTDDALNQELAIAYRKLGDIEGADYTQSTGDFRAAVDSLRRSVALLERVLAGHAANLDARAELSESLRLLAIGELYAGSIGPAEQTARRGADVAAQVLAVDPRSVAHRHLLAAAKRARCDVLAASGDFNASLAECREAIALEESVVRALPADRERRRDLAAMYARAGMTISDNYDSTGSHADLLPEAVSLQRQALAIHESLIIPASDDARLARDITADHANLAETFLVLGDLRAAFDECKTAIGVADALVAKDPANVALRIDSATLKRMLGDLFVSRGQPGPAFQNYEAALALLATLSDRQTNIVAENEHAAMILGLARAHALAASAARQPASERVKRWRAAKHAFEQSAALFESLRARGALDASYAQDRRDAAAGVVQSDAALTKLAASPAVATAN